jgi:hypothetical protein
MISLPLRRVNNSGVAIGDLIQVCTVTSPDLDITSLCGCASIRHHHRARAVEQDFLSCDSKHLCNKYPGIYKYKQSPSGAGSISSALIV